MSLGTGTTNGLSGDSPEFAYYADTATANAAAAALIAAGQSPEPMVMIGPTPATAVAMAWQGATIGYAVGGGSVTPYADFAALVAAIPSPTVGQTAAIAGGGVLKYTAAGWLGSLGVFATLAEAQALTGVADGSTCTVSGDGIVYVSKAA